MNENIQIDSKSGYPMKDVIKFERPINKLKVLFADDEPALQELMHLELPRMGHEVTVCPDGNTAVAAMETTPKKTIAIKVATRRLQESDKIRGYSRAAPRTRLDQPWIELRVRFSKIRVCWRLAVLAARSTEQRSVPTHFRMIWSSDWLSCLPWLQV